MHLYMSEKHILVERTTKSANDNAFQATEEQHLNENS